MVMMHCWPAASRASSLMSILSPMVFCSYSILFASLVAEVLALLIGLLIGFQIGLLIGLDLALDLALLIFLASWCLASYFRPSSSPADHAHRLPFCGLGAEARRNFQ